MMGEDLPQETKTLTAVTFVGALGSATRPSAKRFASGRPSERAACKHDRRRFSCRNCCRAPVASGVTTTSTSAKARSSAAGKSSGHSILSPRLPMARAAARAPAVGRQRLSEGFPQALGQGSPGKRCVSGLVAATARRHARSRHRRRRRHPCPPLAGKQAGPASGRGNRAIWHGGRPRA